VCWPTVCSVWRDELVGLARTIAGRALCPDDFETLRGPPKETWVEILARILSQLEHTHDDVALDQAYVERVADEETNVGRYLEVISGAIAERIDEVPSTRRVARLRS
jgi:hypothetical protein